MDNRAECVNEKEKERQADMRRAREGVMEGGGYRDLARENAGGRKEGFLIADG